LGKQAVAGRNPAASAEVEGCLGVADPHMGALQIRTWSVADPHIRVLIIFSYYLSYELIK
jgi:hypothetical protein